MVCGMHSCAFDFENREVDRLSGAVVFCGMHVYHKGLATKLFGCDAGRICQPVVGMYDVKIAAVAGDLCTYKGIAGDFF